jgi:mannosyltransferase
MVIAIAVAIVVRFRGGTGSRITLLAALWALLPTVALLLLNLKTPSYIGRYLSFGTPAVALLIALGLAAIPWRPLAVFVFLGLIAIAVPVNVGQRTPTAKDGKDWGAIANYVGAHAHPGDSFLFGSMLTEHARGEYRGYPQDFVGLTDIALRTSYENSHGLWDVTDPVNRLGSRLTRAHAIWLMDDGKTARTSVQALNYLEQQGFVLQYRRNYPDDVLYLLTR